MQLDPGVWLINAILATIDGDGSLLRCSFAAEFNTGVTLRSDKLITATRYGTAELGHYLALNTSVVEDLPGSL